MKWLVEFTVDNCWIADGFDLDRKRAERMLRSELPYATGEEITAKIIEGPSIAMIDKTQGFEKWRGKK